MHNAKIIIEKHDDDDIKNKIKFKFCYIKKLLKINFFCLHYLMGWEEDFWETAYVEYR